MDGEVRSVESRSGGTKQIPAAVRTDVVLVRIGSCMLVDRRASLDDGIDVGDGDKDLRRTAAYRFSDRQLVQIAGGVVVDRRPEKIVRSRTSGSDTTEAPTIGPVSATTAVEKSGKRPRWTMSRCTIDSSWFIAAP